MKNAELSTQTLSCCIDRFCAEFQFFLGVVDPYREACGCGDSQALMQWHAAVVACPECYALASEDFCEVVGVDAFEGEGEAAKWRMMNGE